MPSAEHGGRARNQARTAARHRLPQQWDPGRHAQWNQAATGH